MSSTINPPKIQDSSTNSSKLQNYQMNSISTEKKENIDLKLEINKNIDDNDNNPNKNSKLSFYQNEEINFPENKLSNKEIKTKDIIDKLANNLDIEKNKKIEEENKKREFEKVLKNKLYELKELSNSELRQNCKEYYLISREWMIKLNEYLKGENDIKFEDLKNKKNNDEFLIEKEILKRALVLNQEKEKMVILKPKYSFVNTLKPCPVNESFWKFISKTFGLEPEVKEYIEEIEEEDGTIIYKRDYCKYIKINCIILPEKKDYNNISSYSCCYDNVNLSWPTPSKYLEELIHNIQTFYFFSKKYVSIKDLMDTIENIVRKYKDIKLVERSDYKCWIDLNFLDFENLLKLIKDKIGDIYNIYDPNPNSALQLQNLEDSDSRDELCKKKFFFKLYPLKLFENEGLIEIFPNQFTDNFDTINITQLYDRNDKLRIKECPQEILDKTSCFTRFPELTIIIEQGINSLFFKDNSKLSYKIEPCNYHPCSKRSILLTYCECLKKYYCSLNCKSLDKIYHEDECQYSLSNFFISKSNQITKPFMKESSIGLKGIRNIGNTCYMSTALQCMSNCVELRNYFLFGNPRKDVNTNNILGYKGIVAYGFEYLIKKLWVDDEPIIDLNKFKRAMGLCNERFRGRSQQDTHEFVTFLIDSLHEDLNRVNNKIYIAKEERDLSDEIKSKIEWNNFLRRNQSILVDLFYGLFKSTVSCSICNKSCIDFNTFSSISVNLKNNNKKENSAEKNKENDKNTFSNQKDESTNNASMELEKNNEGTEKGNDDENNNGIINQIGRGVREENSNNNSNAENSNKNDDIDKSNSSYKKEGALLGGKPNDSDTLSERKSDNEFFVKIPIIFYFYNLDEKPIQFGLPIRDKKELSHKYLLYKISQILNKDPYSLCLYHISSLEKNITDIYGKNNFSVYNASNLECKILFISEINHDTIKKNLTNETYGIFYDAQIHKYLIDKKNTSREILEQNLNKNREKIKKIINDIIEEKDIENEKLEDKYLSNYYMNLEKVYQFTLKNFIDEKETNGKQHKIFGFPRIIFFSKNINIFDLYFEIFKIHKKILLDEEIDNLTQIKEKFNQLFHSVLASTNLFSPENIPFFMCLRVKNSKLNADFKNILFLEKNSNIKKINEISKNINNLEREKETQLMLEIYWNEKYKEKVINIFRPEKIDKLIEPDLEIREKKQILNESIDSSTRSSKGSNNDDVQKLQRERYNNLYEKYSNLNYATNNINSSNEKNIENNGLNKIENTKNENLGNIQNPLSPSASKIIHNHLEIFNKEITLNETFEILSEEELLDENNEWYCENCKKKQRAKKKLEIYNVPKILIIQIKRFNHINKINTKVDFPLTDLDLSKYTLSNDKQREIKYDLFAVANHYGSLSFGHYTAFCKNSVNEKWYEFNDSSVCEIKDLSKIVSPHAYVLFYKQKGLSKLNWGEIYKKPFISIDINNKSSLIDYNDDFIKYINNNKKKENPNDDVNEYDVKIRDTIKKIDENKNNENILNQKEIKYEPNSNLKMDFLNKKRTLPDKV